MQQENTFSVSRFCNSRSHETTATGHTWLQACDVLAWFSHMHQLTHAQKREINIFTFTMRPLKGGDILTLYIKQFNLK